VSPPLPGQVKHGRPTTRDFLYSMTAQELILVYPGTRTGANDAQTVKAGVNRVQFIFLIAPIRLSNAFIVNLDKSLNPAFGCAPHDA
jgi:hypothetical protein